MSTKIKSKRFLPNMTWTISLMPNLLLWRALLIAGLLMCLGCSSNDQKPLQISGVPQMLTCPAPLYLPPPKAQSHKEVVWKIMTVNGINYAALTMKDYGNLTRNMAEIDSWEAKASAQIKRYLSQKQQVISTKEE